MLNGKKYRVIYADPPWSFKVWSGKGTARAAENHYSTMSLKEIKALPVANIAADDCALFMWAVMPQLPEALDVIEAWGFKYKTCAFSWMKKNKKSDGLFCGLGYWTRANAEICLLATKGKPRRMAKDVRQAVLSPLREHSRKPDEFYDVIRRVTQGPRIDVFSRESREGFTTFGNEAGKFDGQ